MWKDDCISLVGTHKPKENNQNANQKASPNLSTFLYLSITNGIDDENNHQFQTADEDFGDPGEGREHLGLEKINWQRHNRNTRHPCRSNRGANLAAPKTIGTATPIVVPRARPFATTSIEISLVPCLSQGMVEDSHSNPTGPIRPDPPLWGVRIRRVLANPGGHRSDGCRLRTNPLRDRGASAGPPRWRRRATIQPQL